MTTLITPRRAPGAPVSASALFDAGEPAPAAEPLFDPGEPARAPESGLRRDTSGGEPRLDDLVAGLWEGLAAHRPVECPVCGSDLRPEYGAHALPIGGRCHACGSTLG